MAIVGTGQAGTLESSDIMVTISPAEGAKTGIVVDLQSPVVKQYGRHIENLIVSLVSEQGLTDVKVFANDRGALDCTIKARVLTAVARCKKDRI
ncbi:citrate lyase acyl carrier protein [Pelosinus propionicus]|uniref:Citrate lyase subunit gamma (Acyl carrier protein) n=1 Tax=Pelosinus propionicus DSM 13327 TaxID=1123291 RepID=A0A1I4KGF1_9FIRM|nr:citrate lyase acyl carrier protein [Pelosinus propionicus]SFL77828.1 citrate lyase subunit gamma (acyl carrier protein) [Pelosinus propionicus DSM 13327]